MERVLELQNERKISELEQRAFVTTKELSEARVKLVEYNQENLRLKAELERREQEKNEYVSKLDMLRIALDELHDNSAKSSEECSALSAEKILFEAEIMKIANQNKDLEQRLNNYQTQEGNLNDNITKLNAKILEMEADFTNSKTEKALLQAQIDSLSVAKESYATESRRLAGEVTAVDLKLAEVEARKEKEYAFLLEEKEELQRELAELKAEIIQKNEEMANVRSEALEQIKADIRQRTQLEAELQIARDSAHSLSEDVETLKTELNRCRGEVMTAQSVVNEFTVRFDKQDALLRKREEEMEFRLKEKDRIIEMKTAALENLTNEIYPENNSQLILRSPAPSVQSAAQIHKIPQTKAELLEEIVALRQKLVQRQREIDQHQQKFSELIEEVQKRPFARRGSQGDVVGSTDLEHVNKLETQLDDFWTRNRDLTEQLANAQKINQEFEKEVAFLTEQLADRLIPTTMDDEWPELRMPGGLKISKFDNVQQLIGDNLRLRKEIEDIRTKWEDELPAVDIMAVQSENRKLTADLDAHKQCAERHQKQIENLRKTAEFYKMKYDEIAVEGSPVVSSTDDDVPRTRVDYEVQIQKLQCEAKHFADRLAAAHEDQQKREYSHNEILVRKDDLIGQLRTSNETLEINVKSQEEAVKLLNQQLLDLDKTNRKMNEQKEKALAQHGSMTVQLSAAESKISELQSEIRQLKNSTHELQSELYKSKTDAAESQAAIRQYQESSTHSTTVVDALSELRTALSNANQELVENLKSDLKEAREQQSDQIRRTEEMRADHKTVVENMKKALFDAHFVRNLFEKKSKLLEDALQRLQTEHDAATEKVSQLNSQLNDISSSGDNIEACRSENQQLRNKISYLEKNLAEAKHDAERWKAQLDASEKQCNAIKQFSEIKERHAKDSEEKLTIESSRLQEIADEKASILFEREETVTQLNAEVTELRMRLANSDSELTRIVGELRAKMEEVEREKHQGLEAAYGELAAANGNVERLNEQIAEKEKALSETQQNTAALTERIDSLSTQIAELKANEDRLSNDLRTAQQATASGQISVDLRALNDQVASVEKALSESSNAENVAKLQRLFVEMDPEHAAMFGDADPFAASKIEPTISMSEHKAAIDELNAKVEEFRRDLERRSASMTEFNAHSELLSQNSELRTKLEKTEEEAAKERNRLVQLRKLANRFKNEAHDYMAQLKSKGIEPISSATPANQAAPSATASPMNTAEADANVQRKRQRVDETPTSSDAK